TAPSFCPMERCTAFIIGQLTSRAPRTPQIRPINGLSMANQRATLVIRGPCGGCDAASSIRAATSFGLETLPRGRRFDEVLSPPGLDLASKDPEVLGQNILQPGPCRKSSGT